MIYQKLLYKIMRETLFANLFSIKKTVMQCIKTENLESLKKFSLYVW